MRSIPLLSLYSDKQVSKLRVGGVTWNVTCYRHTHATSVEIKAVDLGIPAWIDTQCNETGESCELYRHDKEATTFVATYTLTTVKIHEMKIRWNLLTVKTYFFVSNTFCEQNKFCATNIPVKYAHGCTYKLNTDYIMLTLDVSLQLQMSSYNGKSAIYIYCPTCSNFICPHTRSIMLVVTYNGQV